MFYIDYLIVLILTTQVKHISDQYCSCLATTINLPLVMKRLVNHRLGTAHITHSEAYM